jgi:hypothetical protein
VEEAVLNFGITSAPNQRHAIFLEPDGDRLKMTLKGDVAGC